MVITLSQSPPFCHPPRTPLPPTTTTSHPTYYPPIMISPNHLKLISLRAASQPHGAAPRRMVLTFFNNNSPGDHRHHHLCLPLYSYVGSGNHVTGNYGDCASSCPGAGAQPTSAPTVAPANCRSALFICRFGEPSVIVMVSFIITTALVIEPLHWEPLLGGTELVLRGLWEPLQGMSLSRSLFSTSR